MQNRMKERWDDCQLIASHLTGVTKNQVYDFLLKEINATGMLEQAKAGSPEFLAWIVGTKGWQRMVDPPKVKVHQPKQRGDREAPTTPAEQLKVAMWYINIFETPEASKAAFEAAYTAVTKLRK